MTSERELARLWNDLVARASGESISPAANANGHGYVEALAGGKASIRKNTRDSEPTPGFDVPAWLSLRPGDYVSFHELGSDRVVLDALDRNGKQDWNPLSAQGQIIVAGVDGIPSVIEPPSDPTINNRLHWGGDIQSPIWGDSSLDPPVVDPPPPPPPPPPDDSNFPAMTMWWPYWAGADTTKVGDVAEDMVYMGQGGIVLMGMQWGSDYALPDDVSDKLDIFIAAGIKPYLGLWVGHLTDHDRDTGQAAFDAGEGKWAGIVLDAENQWVQHVRDVGPVQAKIDFDAFMAIFRPLTDQLAVACFASPTSFFNYKYDWWNEVVDTFLPLAYFNSTSDTALNILDTMYRKFADAAADWTSDPKPIIPVMNGYRATLSTGDVSERSDYIGIALDRAEAVQIWRWTETFPDNMREMLHAL